MKDSKQIGDARGRVVAGVPLGLARLSAEPVGRACDIREAYLIRVGKSSLLDAGAVGAAPVTLRIAGVESIKRSGTPAA